MSLTDLYEYLFAYLYTDVQTCIHTVPNVHVAIQTGIPVYFCVCIQVFEQAFIQVSMHIQVFIQICMRLQVFIQICMHIHRYSYRCLRIQVFIQGLRYTPAYTGVHTLAVSLLRISRM